MVPSVRAVLNLPVLQAAGPQVVGGAAALDRPVRWVHLSDASDLRGLLQGGELVLTTGAPLAGPSADVAAYLQMLAELGVVGLFVELGTQLSSIPATAGRQADELLLPVVALRHRIRFVEVTEQVHRMIVVDRYEEVQLARATHETFTTMNLARASPRDIITKASEILQAPVVLEDLARHVLAFCAGGLSATVLLDGWAERSRRNVTSTGGGWLSVPVGTGTQQWGRLVVPAVPVDATRSRMVLERTVQSLLLQRMLEQDREALLVQALGGLVDDLVAGRISDPAEALTRAAALGLSVSARYVPLVLTIERPGTVDALAQGAVDRQLLTAGRHAVTEAGLSAIGSIQRAGVVALVLGCPDPTAVDVALAAVVAGVDQRLAGRVVAGSWAAGTAPPAPDLVTAAAGLAEAAHVAEVGMAMPGRQRLFRSADVRLRGLLALLGSDPRVQAFAATEVGRLRDHDSRTGEDLVGVLRAYLLAGGAKSEAAQLAGLSRPTLYGRLARIERILGVSLTSAESRTSLHVALMIDSPDR